MKKKPLIISLILLLLVLLADQIVIWEHDDIIINSGIRAYRRIHGTTVILSLLLLLLFIGVLIFTLVRHFLADKREKKPQTDNTGEGKLSSRRMDGLALRNMLEENLNEKWAGTAVSVENIEKQMAQMDNYQESLSELLKENGADALADTEDILDQVEQNMFRNIRTVINFMNVADTSDQNKVTREIRACEQKNGSLLKKTKDFLYALTDYLNGNDGDSSSDMLDTYRETILEALKKQSA